jgi:hypothetical protein
LCSCNVNVEEEEDSDHASLLPWRFCRALTTDVPSDIVVEAAGLSFALHKVDTSARTSLDIYTQGM